MFAKLLIIFGFIFVSASTLKFQYQIIDGILDQHWWFHKQRYQLTFDKNEEKYRKQVFEDNVKFIKEHNSQNHGYTVGINQFAHLTNDEFKKLLTLSINKKYTPIENNIIDPIYDNKTIDWRKLGAVTPVKNQKACGSCWAFSTTGSLEGAYYMKTKKLISLSEQDLVDCSTSYGNEGCNGGLMNDSFRYVKDFGIDTEADYPYIGKQDKCKHNNETIVSKISSYVELPVGDENALTKSVFEVGPISVAIDASGLGFQLYTGGVYSSKSCSSTQLDHGVLAVGIGVDPSPHYIVKNSWGGNWGMNGYILMSRNNNNNCGIATAASYPIF